MFADACFKNRLLNQGLIIYGVTGVYNRLGIGTELRKQDRHFVPLGKSFNPNCMPWAEEFHQYKICDKCGLVPNLSLEHGISQVSYRANG